MAANVGNLDRALRIVVGLALLSLPFWLDSPWRWAGLIGIVPVLTGLFRFCPAYTLFGMNTCPMRKSD